jgi:hypothetical protein
MNNKIFLYNIKMENLGEILAKNPIVIDNV